uniref:Uncharacterized protein n=1 Tax=Palpitomonas bilix TaxID=652834 RepID=A0A7S3DA24_9EUKA|mmetsp:Transcript_28100/g.71637  ORF Transcript_28100/g.71637 Transcript_28100/m.71637 type:complete len:227 (+) Transcript_28100:248-928(+)
MGRSMAAMVMAMVLLSAVIGTFGQVYDVDLGVYSPGVEPDDMEGEDFDLAGKAFSNDATYSVIKAACNELVCSSSGICSDDGMAYFTSMMAYGYLNSTSPIFGMARIQGLTLTVALNISGAANASELSFCTCADGVSGIFCNSSVPDEANLDGCGVLGGDGSSCCPYFARADEVGVCSCFSPLVYREATVNVNGVDKLGAICCPVASTGVSCFSDATTLDVICECH